MEVVAATDKATARARPRGRLDRPLGDLATGIAPYVALLVMAVYFSIRAPVFLTVANAQNIIRSAAILLIVAVASTFVILIGSIDLSVGSIVTFSGMTVAFLISTGTSVGAAVLTAVAAGAALGLLNGVVYTVGRIPSFLTTLGTSFIFQGLALQVYGPVPIALRAPSLSGTINSQFLGIPVIGLIAVIALLAGYVLAKLTPIGRGMYAVGGGERAAILAGVDVGRVKVVAFVVSGLLCGLAGVLLAIRINSGTGEMGTSLLLPAIAAVIIGGTHLTGGVGGPHRTVLGVLLLAVLLNGMTLLAVNPFMQLIVQGTVVIVAVLVARSSDRSILVK